MFSLSDCTTAVLNFQVLQLHNVSYVHTLTGVYFLYAKRDEVWFRCHIMVILWPEKY